MDDLSDGDLLQRFRSGESRAFEVLVLRHQAALFRHARALLGPGGGCEDVAQDTFLRLAQKPPELPAEVIGRPDEERAHLLSWLHRVARNGCMDVLRSEKSRKRREEAVASREATGGQVNQVEANDTRAAVERSLETLPEDQREVLVLRLLGERSYREIAEVTGKKIGTVGWLISTGLQSLSRELEPLLGWNASRKVQGEA